MLKPEWADDLGLVEVEGEQEAWWNGLDSASRLRMSIGLAWEQWYISQIAEISGQPGEMHVDGIYMTPDGESIDVLLTPSGPQHIITCHEVKATYKSTKTVGDLTGQWMWLAQTKGYCMGMGTRIAYLHVLFLCGDYKYPITPQLHRWRIEYTQEELEENWTLMQDYLRHRRFMEQGEL